MSSQSLMLADRYRLEEQIAQGGMTSLWRARDEVLARHVAVKILRAELAGDSAFRDRFLKEALAAARLSHPNIAQIYDTGSESLDGTTEQHYIILEYCGGGSLETVAGTHSTLAPQRVTDVGATVCNALAYAHSTDVVHGDLRPANILLTNEGGVKVSDFGIARALFASRDISTTGTILGSVRYLSPEQAEGKEADPRSDLYSLGVVLYELLVGRPPFEDSSDLNALLQRMRQPAPPLRTIKGGLPRALDTAIMKALAIDPADRYQSAEEMRTALQRSGGGGSGSTQVLRATPATRGRDREDTPVVRSSGGTELRKVVPIVLLIAAAVAAALLVPRFLDDGRKDRATPTTQTTVDGGSGGAALKVATATDFDPYGGDGEHPELLGNLTDGDPSTAWTTSDYNDPLQVQKNGVGVLLDLGTSKAVDHIEVTGSPDLTYDIRVSDSPATDETGFEVVQKVSGSQGKQDIDTSETEGRYWLLWITELPGGGAGNASIGEVRFFGP
jgi:hypothetical protein